jgi:alpha-L-fucosidase
MGTKSTQPTHTYIVIVASIFCAVVLTCCSQITGKAALPETKLRAEQAKWFQDSKFGMFIHWGVYAVPGRGEWVMNKEKMTVDEYEKFAEQFNPVEYDPAEWVQIAKNAGMKYIVITSKHHDGFAMWDSKVSNWDIVDRTPYGKDVLKMLADECKKQGIALFFYHSQLD